MSTLTPPTEQFQPQSSGLLATLRRWLGGRLDRFEVQNLRVARLICHLIPCTCPFEKKFTLFGYSFHTPPLCEINPFYNELVALRLRALDYLATQGVDTTPYIC